MHCQCFRACAKLTHEGRDTSRLVEVKNVKMTRKVIPPHRVVTQEEVVGFGSSLVEAEAFGSDTAFARVLKIQFFILT